MSGLTFKEQLAFAGLIWLAVYPAVLSMNYALRAVGLGDLPLPAAVFLTTIATVPILKFVIIPKIKDVMAKAERKLGVDGGMRDD